MDKIDYGKLVDDAMHLIVYEVLKIIEKDGLPDDHHFFISFLTKHKGVKVSKALQNKYPHEMTIVLQYQFNDLKVTKEGFSVVLSFSGSQESIYIPFEAITTFADPSVQFGLQFRDADDMMSDGDDAYELEEEDAALDMITREIKRQMEDEDSAIGKKPTKGVKSKGKSAAKGDQDNVVSLDKLRKNKGK